MAGCSWLQHSYWCFDQIYKYNFNWNQKWTIIFEIIKELLGKMGKKLQMIDIGDEEEIAGGEFKECLEDEIIEFYRIRGYPAVVER